MAWKLQHPQTPGAERHSPAKGGGFARGSSTCSPPGGRAPTRCQAPQEPRWSCPAPCWPAGLPRRAPPPGSQPAALPPRGRPQPAGVKAAVPGVAGRPCAHGHDGGGHPPGLAGQGQLQDAQRVTGALREKEQDALTERRRTHVNAARPHEGSRGAGADPPGRGLCETRRTARQPRDSPRSVWGPAMSCLNLSSREASLSLDAELPRVLGSDVPPSAPAAECGRDRDLCRGAVSLALSAEGERTEGEGSGPRAAALPPPRRPRTCCATSRVNAAMPRGPPKLASTCAPPPPAALAQGHRRGPLGGRTGTPGHSGRLGTRSGQGLPARPTRAVA